MRTLILLLMACALTAQAQTIPVPQLKAIFPAGGQHGTVVAVDLTATQVEDIDRLIFSHPGIVAHRVTESLKPILDREIPTPGKFTVSIRQDTPPGIYDVRAQSRYGISNPRSFMVSDHPEIMEKPGREISTAQAIPLHTVINGRTVASQVNYFKFPARKGHPLVIDAQAERIDSSADLTLKILTTGGLPLQEYRDTVYRDPIAVFEPPADGEYILGVYDFTYKADAESFYRFIIHDRPFIQDAFPPAMAAGKKQLVRFSGVHLPPAMQQVEVQAPTVPSPPDQPYQLSNPGFDFTHPGNGQILRFSLATAPVMIVQDAQQAIPVPSEVVGKFNGKDAFLIDGKKDQPLVIEVLSHRMGNATDPYIVIEKVAVNDQQETTYTFLTEQDDTKSDIGGPRYATSHRDPIFTLKPDADAKYRIQLFDRFGTASSYRLAVRAANPDFSLFATSEMPGMDQKKAEPWNPILLKQGAVPMKVSVVRRDGFDAPITLSIEGLPPSITCPPATLSAKAKSTTLLLRAAQEAWSGPIRILGKANVAGRELTREAAFSTTIWSTANLAEQYHRARFTQENTLVVVNEPTEPATLTPVDNQRVWESCLGAKFDLPLKITKHAELKGDTTINCLAFPGYAKLPNAKITKDKDEGVFKFDFNKNNNKALKPGTYQLVFTTATTFKWTPDTTLKDAAEKEKADLEAAYKKQEERVKTRGNERQVAQQFIKQEQERVKKEALTDEAAKKAVAEAEGKFKAADRAEKDARDLLNKAKSTRDASTARAKKVAERLKERDLKHTGYSQPITLKLAAAPVAIKKHSDKLEAVPESKAELKINTEKKYGFAEGIDFTVVLPKDLKGIKIDKVTLPKDKNDATLVLEIAKDAPHGEHPLELKTSYKFNGQGFEDTQAFVLVVKPPPPPPAPAPAPAPEENKKSPADGS